MSQQGTKDCHK
jgi:methylated-DNA-protein-cysteine methyltransferase-like protein